MTIEEYAEFKHRGQTRRDGTPYIDHPRRVASTFREGSTQYKVALLHDTLEDTDATFEEIQDLFGLSVADAVRVLTHDKNVPYEDYIKIIIDYPLALSVKFADMADNLADNPTEKQRKKYADALRIISRSI